MGVTSTTTDMKNAKYSADIQRGLSLISDIIWEIFEEVHTLVPYIAARYKTTEAGRMCEVCSK